MEYWLFDKNKYDCTKYKHEWKQILYHRDINRPIFTYCSPNLICHDIRFREQILPLLSIACTYDNRVFYECCKTLKRQWRSNNTDRTVKLQKFLFKLTIVKRRMARRHYCAWMERFCWNLNSVKTLIIKIKLYFVIYIYMYVLTWFLIKTLNIK